MITFSTYYDIPSLFEGPCYVTQQKALIWFARGTLFHRLDGPAVIKDDGTEEWYYHHELHRIGGPAITRPNKTSCFYVNGWLIGEKYYWTHPLVQNHPVAILKKLNEIIEA